MADKLPRHRDLEESAVDDRTRRPHDPYGVQRSVDGWQFMGRLGLFFGSFLAVRWLVDLVNDRPEHAPLIAVGGSVLFFVVAGVVFWWLDRLGRVRQGYSARQETISGRAWWVEVVVTGLTAATSIMFLVIAGRTADWSHVPFAVFFGLLTLTNLRRLRRLRTRRVPGRRVDR